MKNWKIGLVALLSFIIGVPLFFYANKRRTQIPSKSSSTDSSTSDVTKAVPLLYAPSSSSYPTLDPVPQQEQLENIFETPINFWGKVIDEDGGSISGAHVQLTAADQPHSDKRTSYSGTSDVNGLFFVVDLKGAGLYVEVTKEGYDNTETSSRLFGYGIRNSNKPPTSSEPAIFVLRKAGNAKPLKVFSSGSILVPKNGQRVKLSLTRGPATSDSEDEIQIEVWTQDQLKDAEGRYPWRYQISVPNGGLVQRKSDNDFIAPESGYETADAVDMAPIPEQWSPRIDREYYVKLSDGTFGRLRLGVRTGGAHYVVIDSFYNPSGSRNLEYDPTKTFPNR